MNINLRKANAIQNSIQDTINSIESSHSIEINEFQDPAKELQAANDLLIANDTRKQRLLQAFYNIRALVATANAGCGISTNLAKAAFIEKRIQQLGQLANCKPALDISIINGRLEKIKNRSSDSDYYGRNESVSTSVIGQNQIDQAKAEIKSLKKQKQKINDENLDLNVKTEIPLSEDTVKVLTDEGIL